MTANAIDPAIVCGGKFHYATAGAAWDALRHLTTRVKKGRGKKRPEAKGSTPLRVYRCRCSRWAIGHSAAHIKER